MVQAVRSLLGRWLVSRQAYDLLEREKAFIYARARKAERELETFERINRGELIDQTHIEWRANPGSLMMEAWCVHCGKQRPGIDATYKGNWYFSPCPHCQQKRSA